MTAPEQQTRLQCCCLACSLPSLPLLGRCSQSLYCQGTMREVVLLPGKAKVKLRQHISHGIYFSTIFADLILIRINDHYTWTTRRNFSNATFDSGAYSPDKSEKNILVWNDQFYSENAFGHRFQCLQLFIGFSMQFIDFPDIGQLQ